MNRKRVLWMAAIFVGILALAAWLATSTLAQSASPQATPKVTAEQQKQLDQLKQLEDQLTKDRTAVHDAITNYGWDSDQTDAAQEQLFRDRTEYRQLRRTLRQAGVPTSPAAGFGPGGPGPGPGGMRMGMGGRGGHAMMGRGMCDCPCMGK